MHTSIFLLFSLAGPTLAGRDVGSHSPHCNHDESTHSPKYQIPLIESTVLRGNGCPPGSFSEEIDNTRGSAYWKGNYHDFVVNTPGEEKSCSVKWHVKKPVGYKYAALFLL